MQMIQVRWQKYIPQLQNELSMFFAAIPINGQNQIMDSLNELVNTMANLNQEKLNEKLKQTFSELMRQLESEVTVRQAKQEKLQKHISDLAGAIDFARKAKDGKLKENLEKKIAH